MVGGEGWIRVAQIDQALQVPLTFGKRQSPAMLPSESPQLPWPRAIHIGHRGGPIRDAQDVAIGILQPESTRSDCPPLCHRPCQESVSFGNGTPAWISPSSPVAYKMVCPVTSTGALAKADIFPPPIPPGNHHDHQHCFQRPASSAASFSSFLHHSLHSNGNLHVLSVTFSTTS